MHDRNEVPLLRFPRRASLPSPLRATTRDCPYLQCRFCRGNPLWLPLNGDGSFAPRGKALALDSKISDNSWFSTYLSIFSSKIVKTI